MRAIAKKTSHIDKDQIKSPMRLYFEDECPRIGSGWRTVEVKVGRKWVRFTDTASDAKARLSLKDALPVILGSIERSSR